MSVVARKMKSHRAPLNPVKPETEPFRKIAIDIVGELPRTTTGHKYILTIVDYATRYIASLSFPISIVKGIFGACATLTTKFSW